jgi:hypothetical protein
MVSVDGIWNAAKGAIDLKGEVTLELGGELRSTNLDGML